MSLVLLLILIAVILGIIGFAVKSLLYLFFIGIAVLVIAFLLGGFRVGRHRRRPPGDA